MTTPAELLSQARDALKPCPHCGLLHTLKLTTAQELAEEGEDDPEPWMHSDSWAVICDMSRPNGPGGCGASGGFYPSQAEAVSAWNRRAEIDTHLKHSAGRAEPNAGMGLPSCGKPLCSEGDHHPLCTMHGSQQPSAPSGEPADLMGEARHAITALLSLIRRNAPELSGKTLGYAEAVAAKITTAQAAPASSGSAWVDANVSGNPSLMQAMRNHATQAAPAPQAAVQPLTDDDIELMMLPWAKEGGPWHEYERNDIISGVRAVLAAADITATMAKGQQ